MIEFVLHRLAQLRPVKITRDLKRFFYCFLLLKRLFYLPRLAFAVRLTILDTNGRVPMTNSPLPLFFF